MLTRRAAIAALSGLAAARAARAEHVPSRPITIVVPYAAGEPADTLARLIARSLAVNLGQAIVVANRPGEAGVTGTLAASHAKPDGHTLVLGSNETHVINPNLLKNCPYDAVRDFAAVAGLVSAPHVLVARSSLRVGAVAELIAGAKAMPDNFYYGSTGVGSASHLVGELFKERVGADIRHVPDDGTAPMVAQLLARRIDVSFAALPSVIAPIEAGELKALAMASARRSALLPRVPTLSELGVTGVEADSWFALFAPAGTSAAVTTRLYDAVATGLNAPEARAAIARNGMTLTLRPPNELAAWLPAEAANWAALIKAAGVVVE